MFFFVSFPLWAGPAPFCCLRRSLPATFFFPSGMLSPPFQNNFLLFFLLHDRPFWVSCRICTPRPWFFVQVLEYLGRILLLMSSLSQSHSPVFLWLAIFPPHFLYFYFQDSSQLCFTVFILPPPWYPCSFQSFNSTFVGSCIYICTKKLHDFIHACSQQKIRSTYWITMPICVSLVIVVHFLHVITTFLCPCSFTIGFIIVLWGWLPALCRLMFILLKSLFSSLLQQWPLCSPCSKHLNANVTYLPLWFPSAAILPDENDASFNPMLSSSVLVTPYSCRLLASLLFWKRIMQSAPLTAICCLVSALVPGPSLLPFCISRHNVFLHEIIFSPVVVYTYGLPPSTCWTIIPIAIFHWECQYIHAGQEVERD